MANWLNIYIYILNDAEITWWKPIWTWYGIGVLLVLYNTDSFGIHSGVRSALRCLDPSPPIHHLPSLLSWDFYLAEKLEKKQVEEEVEVEAKKVAVVLVAVLAVAVVAAALSVLGAAEAAGAAVVVAVAVVGSGW